MALCQTSKQKKPVLIRMITMDDYGKKLVLSKGYFFKLQLKNHLDGGFVLNGPQFNSSVLVLYKYSKKTPLNGPVGAPGTESWLFKAVKRGSTQLKVTSTRPWIKKDSVMTFVNEIVVK